ncbi:transcriptional regulator [Bacillus sp. AFS073361]|uniref:helix-turn-helix domain-containing protein n=1 Tax=Bacillus sp. AFS073361 TaxID=2033511 RepID=UPI000BF694F7|nr:helix-turn-helix transcriptional regulator [Bacillus sp. AFS073361]PFP29370.1 transcriptional regulator [Bacillus sp. AFS073361]
MTEEIQNKERARQFGKRLKALRLSRDYTMQDIAEQVGIARSTYAGYETQERFPPIETLSRVAACLNTSTDYLIGLTDNPDPKEPTHNIEEYLRTIHDLNWNGIPLTHEDLKPLRDLFTIVLRERLPKLDDSKPSNDE